MAREKRAYAPGENPTSLKNLRPRQTTYEEAKKQRAVLVTATGWEGFKALAEALGLSASELVEQLGRGAIAIKSPKPQKK